ncbi:unnamed protein product [Somion occarium]|uniref:Autophagy-related protein 27 n=1 Tax=Somion occarium TaxID=3059160 RepID=A0ABP1CF18_9APHY
MLRISDLWLLSFVVLSCLTPHALADDKSCTTTVDGKHYDLNQLKANKDYTFKSLGGQPYRINVCAPVVSEIWAPKVDKPEEIAAVTRRQHGDFSIGAVNTTLTVIGGHPMLLLTGGNLCLDGSDLRASTAVRFICDTAVFGAGKPELIAQFPPQDDAACAFFVEWRTHVACPTHERGSWSFIAILATIFGVLFMLYIIVGLLYNRFVLDLRGFDQIPRYSLISFSDVVQFFRNCIDRVKSRTPDFGGGGGVNGSWGRSGSDYRGLAASGEEGASMLGGPPGFLDEEDEGEENIHGSDPESGRPQGVDSNGVIRL